MSEKIIYSMIKVGRVFPPNVKPVLRDITLGFYYGAKIGVIGLNGSGKSTLLRIIAGKDKDYTGEIIPSTGYTVGMFEQEPQLESGRTVKDIVQEGVQPIMDLLARYDAINLEYANENADMDKLMAEQARVQDEIERLDAWDIDSKLELAMDALRCPPPEAVVDNLSGGERRRVALCRLLLSEPDILLLDEPTNHLDAESVAWLERHLKQYKGTVIAVTHDRYFLDNVAGWILELEFGYGIPWKGNYSSWLEQKSRQLAMDEKSNKKREKTLQRELDWIHMAPRARQAKGKARINAYENLLSQESDKRRDELEIYIPPGPRLGDVVIECKDLSKSFGDRIIFEKLTATIPPGSIVGIIGPNGAGKTTLLKIIAGLEKPDTGTITIGQTVKLAYVEQLRETLNGERTVWEEISDEQELITLGNRRVNSRSYVASFNFVGPEHQKKVKTLSGGERNRVLLAKMLKIGANVLMLDEPTNDLDVNTLRALEESIEEYAGCALVVSHDRWFLDRVATHILAFDEEGQAQFYLGNFSDYEEERHKRLGQEADRPHRRKFQNLTR